MAVTVPKRVFFFWSGEKMSWLRYLTLKSFRHWNPDWQMDLYLCPDNAMKKTWDCPNQQDFFCYKGEDYFDRVPELGINIKPWEVLDLKGNSWATRITPSQKSNFFKWQTLHQEGGIYADMDILWTAPIESYYDMLEDKGMSICYTEFFSIGLLAAAPGCKFYGDVWKNGFTCFDKKTYQTAGVINVYNWLAKVANHMPRHGKALQLRSWDILEEHYGDCNLHNIPVRLVYPWIFDQLDHVWTNIHIHQELPAETIGIHWYAGAESAQWHNMRLTPETLDNYNNTVTHHIRQIL